MSPAPLTLPVPTMRLTFAAIKSTSVTMNVIGAPVKNRGATLKNIGAALKNEERLSKI